MLDGEDPTGSIQSSTEEPGCAVRIDTRLVTVELSGPKATADAAYALWERVYNSLTPQDGRGGRLSAAPVGFSAELVEPEFR